MHASGKVRPPRSPPDVTPEASPRAGTTLAETLGHSIQTTLKFSRFNESFAFAVVVSHGVVGSCDHALTLTSLRRRDPSRVPSLGRPLETGVNGTMNPSDSRPARSAFAVGLYGSPLPDIGGRDGSLLFRIELCPHALLPTPRPSCVAPIRPNAVCCLRRGMSGSAGTTFRVFISRGCKLRFWLGLRTCSPPTRPTARSGPLTPHSDGRISSHARGLLRGASALTATGLAPVSSMQLSGRTMAGDCSGNDSVENGKGTAIIPQRATAIHVEADFKAIAQVPVPSVAARAPLHPLRLHRQPRPPHDHRLPHPVPRRRL